MLSMAMAAMEMTIVSTAMPTIIGELGGLHLYAWVTASYLLTSTVTVPLYGKLSDVVGRKPVLLGGISLFLVGSIACALSGSVPVLIAARALQGLGAGAMQPMSLTIVGDLFDIRERARVQPWFGAVWGIAGLAGPLLGGLIVKHLSWPFVFWINLPFGVAAMAVLSFAFREEVKRRAVKVDFLGAALLAAAVVSLLVAVEGVRTGPLLALSLVTAVLFVVVERRAPEPVVPLDLFTTRVLGLGNLLAAILGGIMIGLATYVPLFVQGVAHGSPTEAGGAITPMVVGWPIAAYVAGRLLPRVGYRPLIVIGMIQVGVSALVLPFVAHDPSVSPWTLRVLATAVGWGMGFANTALIIVVQSSVPWERRGIATASNMFARTIGATLAVGAMGALLSNVVRDEANVAPEVMQAILLRTKTIATVGDGARVVAALAHGLGLVFWANALLGVVGIAAGLFFPSIPATEPAREVAPAH